MKERGNKINKFIDKFLGSLILFLLGISHRKRINCLPTKCNAVRVAVIKTGALGDALLVGSAIGLIKKKWPGAYIIFICTASNVQAVLGLSGVDRIYVFNLKKPLFSLALFNDLGMYDLLLDFAPWARLNGIISYFIKARCRVGFKTPGMYRHYIYDIVVKHSSKIHELDNYKNLLAAAGIEGDLPDPLFTINRKNVGIVDSIIRDKTVVFHPFPGGALRHLKSWPEERWVKLGHKISALGYQIIISGGPDDALPAERIAGKIGTETTLSLAGRADLNQIAYTIKRAGCLISVNTGVMHLGAAVGARVISLNGPTNPDRWGPKGRDIVILKPKRACSPCISLGFESKCKLGGCMEDISVDDVFKVFMKLK